MNTKRKFNISKEELNDLYINKNLSSKKISLMFGVSVFPVLTRLKEFNISKGVFDSNGKLQPWNKGKKMSKEHCNNLKKAWKNPLTIEKHMKQYKNPDIVKSRSEHSKQNWQTPEYIKKQMDIINNPEHKLNLTQKVSALWKNPDYIKMQMDIRTSKKCREKVSEGKKKGWQTEIVKENYKKGRLNNIENINKGILKSHSYSHKQTKPEKKIQSYLDSTYPNEWLYTGSGKNVSMIGNHIPDFMNCNGKKQVIEHLGTYWHYGRHLKDNPNYTREKEEFKLKEHYKKFGFDCLCIWESELKNEEAVCNKIKDFCFEPVGVLN